jgi:hypothetical protein
MGTATYVTCASAMQPCPAPFPRIGSAGSDLNEKVTRDRLCRHLRRSLDSNPTVRGAEPTLSWLLGRLSQPASHAVER